jgi:hypothetical protein
MMPSPNDRSSEVLPLVGLRFVSVKEEGPPTLD